jgi:hypothetical protein
MFRALAGAVSSAKDPSGDGRDRQDTDDHERSKPAAIVAVATQTIPNTATAVSTATNSPALTIFSARHSACACARVSGSCDGLAFMIVIYRLPELTPSLRDRPEPSRDLLVPCLRVCGVTTSDRSSPRSVCPQPPAWRTGFLTLV